MKMQKVNKSLGLLFLIIIIGAIVGGIIGEIIGTIAPEESIIRQIFLKGPDLTLVPNTLNLKVLAITFGFNLKINICGILGIFIAAFIFRRI